MDGMASEAFTSAAWFSEAVVICYHEKKEIGEDAEAERTRVNIGAERDSKGYVKLA